MPPDKRINMHKWCLSSEDTVIEGQEFKSWNSLISGVGVDHVDLLKLDIEGYEWNTLPYLLQSSLSENLPRQITLELHFFPPWHAVTCFQGSFQPKGTPPEFLAKNGTDYLHPTIRLFQLFYERGYHVSSSEYNHFSIEECCQEFTFVRP